MKMRKTAVLASILSVLVLAGCSQGVEKKVDEAKDKAANATATVAKQVEKTANEVATKVEEQNKVWTLEEIKNSKDFVAVAKDEVGVSYVYVPSIKVQSDNDKETLEATVWRDYQQDQQVIKEEQKYEFNKKDKVAYLGMKPEKIYTYAGQFVKDGEGRNMMEVDKDAYGYIMGQNILKVKKGEPVHL